MNRLKTGLILLLLAALAGSVAWAATGGEAEVRITARQLDDGRVEFALQQRVDGEWGERILPPSRYFPASVGHNRWLNSTAMTVSVASDEMTELQPTAPPTGGAIHTTAGAGKTPSGADWIVAFDDFDDSRQAGVFPPSSGNSSIYEATFLLACYNNGTQLLGSFANLPPSDLDDGYTITFRWDSAPATTVWVADSGTRQVLVDARLFRTRALSHDTLRVRIVGYSTTITVTYNIAAMREAPTWANILACGS